MKDRKDMLELEFKKISLIVVTIMEMIFALCCFSSFIMSDYLNTLCLATLGCITMYASKHIYHSKDFCIEKRNKPSGHLKEKYVVSNE